MKRTILFFTILSLLSCKKGIDCENWQVMDYCVPKSASVLCNDPHTYTTSICGSDLQDAHNGKVKVRLDNQNATLLRQYIKKMP